MATTITFFVPDAANEYADRTDTRVRVIDHDEVTKTTKVEFPDGYRTVVRDVDLVTREA